MTTLALLGLTLSVTPNTGFSPLWVRAKVTVEPNDLNRMVCLAWPDGSSCYTIDGAGAAVTHYFKIKLESPGSHTFVASVYQGAAGWQRSEGRTVNVAEGGPGR